MTNDTYLSFVIRHLARILGGGVVAGYVVCGRVTDDIYTIIIFLKLICSKRYKYIMTYKGAVRQSPQQLGINSAF